MTLYRHKYSIGRNFGMTLLSHYEPQTPPFQIDANFGYTAALIVRLRFLDLPMNGKSLMRCIEWSPTSP